MHQAVPGQGGDEPVTRVYENRLKPILNAPPILGDYPDFVEPVREVARFEAPLLIDDPGADLEVRAWRFSYNARGIIEVPNRLRSNRTAVIVVHPWGIDDGQGWRSPEPAGVAFQCTPAKNKIVLDHAAKVINPFLKTMRGKAGLLVGYSLAGNGRPDSPEDLSVVAQSSRPKQERREGERELKAKLEAFDYHGQAIPTSISVNSETPTLAYFKQFPRPRFRAGLRRPRVLGSADPGDEIDRGRSPRLCHLRRRGLPCPAQLSPETRHPARAAGGLQYRYVRLFDDGRLQEPRSGLRRFSGR